MKVNIEQFNELLEMQKVLDADILREKGLTLEETYNKRVIAALIELGEFANEQRFFKYWSNKGPSEKETRLEEYVDILHFLLSTLYIRGYRGENLSILEVEGDWEEVWQNTAAEILGLSKLWEDLWGEEYLLEPVTSVHFGKVFSFYFRLGELAGFEWEEVVEEYKRKNAVNFERLRSGYQLLFLWEGDREE